SRHATELRTVSIIFEDADFTEAEYIQSVANRIGSEHVPLVLRPDHLLGWLDDAFDAMDQPTFDGINTYVVSRASAESGLSVALSGLGADELFDGYGYVTRVRALERARGLPHPVRRVVGQALRPVFSGERG